MSARRRVRVVAFLAALSLVAPAAAWAQTTGRISGRVEDATTGQPLAGARVAVEAQGKTAETTEQGRFVIAGLPAGEVDLSVELLGYQSLRLEGVGVRAGRAAELVLALEPTQIEIEPLVVDADRIPLIEPEVARTREVLTGEVLRELPVTRVGEAVELSTGVSDGHFRGGQVGQEAYVIDGFAVKNQVESTTGGASIELAPTSLEELEVVTGGFSAEYGSALSGVVSYTTRRGSEERWEGEASLRSDHVAPASASTGLASLDVNGGGPLPFLGERATLFADLQLEGLNDADPRARGLTCLRPGDGGAALDAQIEALQNDPAATHLYCPYERDGLPGQLGDRLIGFLRLDRPALGGLFTATLLHNRFQRELYTQELKYSADSRLAQRNKATLGTLTFDVGGQTGSGADRLTLRLAAQRIDRYLGAIDLGAFGQRSTVAGFGLSDFEFLGEDYVRSPIEDQIENPQPVPGYETPDGLRNSPFGPAGEGLFITEGTSGIANWSRSDMLGADLVGEKFLANGNSFRAGLTGKLYRVEIYERTRAYLAGSSPNYARFYPSQVAGFTEASIRPEELFTVTAGLRIEGFRNGLEFRPVPGDFLAPAVTTDWKWHFGPHLGFAGAIRNSAGRTAFKVNYARMAQPPDFQFFIDNTIGDSLRTDIRRQGNPNLAFEEGSTIEAGVSHLFLERIGIEIVGFHKELGNLVTGNVQLVGTAPGQFTTGDKGTVNGIELSALARWPNVFARVGYSLQKAEGLTSGAFADTSSTEPGQPEPVPLAFDRRHTIDLTLLLGRAARAAANAPGGLPVGAVLTARVRSGYPLYPLQVVDEDGRTNPIGRLPWTALVDLAATWELPGLPGCERCGVRLVAEVKNLLDRENLIALRRETGTIAPSLGTLQDQASAPVSSEFPIPRESSRYSPSVDLDGDGLISGEEFATARFAAVLDRNDPSLYYGPPRQLRVGVEVTF
ncbi:MAG: TonB-dependent receptor [Gemmatimonadales bacterium]|jgi:hypothetical protein